MWLKLSSSGHRLYVLNDIMLYYRIHDSNTYNYLSFMRDCIEKTLSDYREHPSFQRVYNKKMNSLFLTAAKHRDRTLAMSILKELNPRHYSTSTLRGVMKLFF